MFDVVTLAPGLARFLPECIASVQRQGSALGRHIVVDPTMDDDIARICARNLRPCDVLVTTPDSGPAEGLNNGLQQVEAPYFAYVNADDRLTDGALAAAAAHLTAADVVVGDLYVIDEDGKRQYRHRGSRVSAFRIACRATQVAQQSTFYRTEPVRRVGGFNVANPVCWDTELLLRLAMAGYSFRYSSAIWAEFRLYSESISGSGRLADQYEAERARLAALAGHPELAGAFGRSVGRVLRYLDRPGLLLQGVRKRVSAA